MHENTLPLMFCELAKGFNVRISLIFYILYHSVVTISKNEKETSDSVEILFASSSTEKPSIKRKHFQFSEGK